MTGKSIRFTFLMTLLCGVLLAFAACGAGSDFDGDDDDDFDGNAGDDDDDNDAGDDSSGDDDDSAGDTPTTQFQLKIMDAPVDEASAIWITFDTVRVHYAGEWPEEEGDDDDDEEGEEEESGDDDDEEPAEKPGPPGGDDDDDDDEEGEEEEGEEGEGNGTWIDLPLELTTVNLLDYQNGVNDYLANVELPVGHYTEIRLMLDCVDNPPSIVIDEVEHDLFIPSGCQSGVKLVSGWDLVEGVPLSLMLDFDLRRSIHQTGAGQYIMQPTIRVIQEHTAGAISGAIDPVTEDAAVHAYPDGAYPDGEYESSTMPDAAGDFVLAALPEGLYDVVVIADGMFDAVVEDVVVVAGENVDVGTVSMEPSIE